MLRLFFALTLALILTGCASMPSVVTHEATGYLLPSNIDDMTLRSAGDYNPQTQSSSIIYGDSVATISVFFHDGDITAKEYFENSRHILATVTEIDRALTEGNISITANEQTLNGELIRGYVDNKVQRSEDMELAKVESVSVYPFDNQLIKIRSSQIVLLGEFSKPSINIMRDKEQAVLNAILTQQVDEPESYYY